MRSGEGEGERRTQVRKPAEGTAGPTAPGPLPGLEARDRIELAPGYEISRIIVGGWQLAQGHGGGIPAEESPRTFLTGLAEMGFTTFDCADIYTGVEETLGDFLAHYRRSRPEAPIRIHTKFVPDLDALPRMNRAYVERIIHRSLRRLGVEVLDLVQFHWWDFQIPGFMEAARWLDGLRQAGKIRHLGVTNFDRDHLTQLVDAGIPILSNQVQYSVLDRRPSVSLAAYCREKGIALLCYGGLSGGFLTPLWVGMARAPGELANRSLVKYRLIIDEMGGWEAYQRILDALDTVAQRHRVSIPAVALGWVLDQPAVAATITGLDSLEQAGHTRKALDLRFGEEDRAALDAALSAARIPSGPVYGLERNREGPHGRIMKYNLNRE